MLSVSARHPESQRALGGPTPVLALARAATAPRGEVVRGHLNHLIHHQGQLTVSLRLVDVPLSQIYGPTADEPW